jgi:hypothetical protein
VRLSWFSLGALESFRTLGELAGNCAIVPPLGVLPPVSSSPFPSFPFYLTAMMT